MQIGELAHHTGVNIETIRYYERAGVLPKPSRLGNGRRIYGDLDVRRLGFIRHARDLGFNLQAVQTLLALQETPQASCADASRIAQAQLDEVDQRIARLRSLQLELSKMVTECQKGVVAECRVIEALSMPSP